jgi:hypothetical protein
VGADELLAVADGRSATGRGQGCTRVSREKQRGAAALDFRRAGGKVIAGGEEWRHLFFILILKAVGGRVRTFASVWWDSSVKYACG